MVTEPQIRTAIAAKIQANDAGAQVHKRRRYPKQNQVAEYARLFRDANLPFINGYMIRRLRRVPLLHGIPKRLVSVTHTYEIRFFYSLIEDDDPAIASEEIAQPKIDALAALFESDNTLGLGGCVTHNGLELPQDFEDVIFADIACHRAVMRLVVTAANVNC